MSQVVFRECDEGPRGCGRAATCLFDTFFVPQWVNHMLPGCGKKGGFSYKLVLAVSRSILHRSARSLHRCTLLVCSFHASTKPRITLLFFHFKRSCNLGTHMHSYLHDTYLLPLVPRTPSNSLYQQISTPVFLCPRDAHP